MNETRFVPARRSRVLIGSLIALGVAVGARGQTGPATPDNVWTTSGPGGGTVLSVALDPASPSSLFAGTETGLFHSADGGRSWQAAASSPPRARTILVDPANARNLFAASADGIFHSTDGGDHFSLSGLSGSVTALAFDPTSPSTIYAARGRLLEKTTDAGMTWQYLPGSYDLASSIASLVVEATHPATVYVGADFDYDYVVSPAAVYRFKDDGSGATVVLSRDSTPRIDPRSDGVRSVAIDPTLNDVLYVATWNPYGSGGAVFRSGNAGADWHVSHLPLAANATSLVIDPVSPRTLYVGTDRGVFRSVDAAANWTRLADGLTDVGVNALAIDPTGTRLHAATGSGVFDIHLRSVAAAGPCTPDPITLCLLGGRFSVTLQAQDPRSGRLTSGVSVAETDDFGYFSLPEFTGDASFPEVLAKMVDAGPTPSRNFWFFFAGLTDLSYLLTVTDTSSGETRSYFNAPESPFCGGADTSAFRAAGETSAGEIPRSAGVALPSSGDTLSLLSGRFHFRLSATDPRTGRTAIGEAIPRDERFGYFSLPAFTANPGLPEVFVKMMDVTSLSGTDWLFFGSLTDLAYTLTMTDTVTGAVTTYPSPGAFCGGADTGIASRAAR